MNDTVWSFNSSSSFNITGKLQFNCSWASFLLQICTSRFSLVKTVFVPAVCVVGILGNLLTLFVLSRRRFTVISDSSVRAVHSCMKALAASDLVLCASLLPHGFLPHDCIVHVRRSFHLVYWLYSGAVINTFILASTWLTVMWSINQLIAGRFTWLTVAMAVGRYLAVFYPFHVKPLIDLRCTRSTITAIFVVSFLVNVPRFFENAVQSIPCPDSSSTILIQSPGPLQMFDRRLMRGYVWLYCVLGIFVPLTLLAVGNCGLVKALRRSTHLRRQFQVRHSHADANERVTTVLATVVVAYIALVAPAEIVLFIERQLSDEGALAAGRHLALAIDITNVMQTVRLPTLAQTPTVAIWVQL